MPAIERIIDEAYSPYIADIGRKPAPMTADYRDLILRGLVCVAEQKSGDISALLIDYPADDHWFVETIAVASSLQGRGMGRRIMAAAENRARDAGYNVVRLYTNVKMTGNLVFYPRLGYLETERVTEDGFSRVYFEKKLS